MRPQCQIKYIIGFTVFLLGGTIDGYLDGRTDGWMDGHVVHALEEIIEEIPKFVSRTTLIPGDTNSCATVLKSSPTLKNLVRKCSI